MTRPGRIAYARMPIEVEAPEAYGYERIAHNLAESSIADRSLSELGLAVPDLRLIYDDHRGAPALRALIAAEASPCGPDDVLVTPGAAGALFIVATALLGGGDELVVMRPNYATNLETPRALGVEVRCLDLAFEDGFAFDVDAVARLVGPRTALISITTPHNPTGTMISAAQLQALADLAASAGCPLLVDETYRDLTLGDRLPVAASLGEHVISVASLSKAYGVPGLRLGWILCRDAALMQRFLAAKEQISISGSVIDEWVAARILERREALLGPTLVEMRRRRDQVAAWIAAEPRLEWVRPAGGVVCFPRMKAAPAGGTEAFYARLLADHGVYLAPGHWFERPDTHFRLGYGWPTADSLTAGLAAISAALG